MLSEINKYISDHLSAEIQLILVWMNIDLLEGTLADSWILTDIIRMTGTALVYA